MKAHIRKYVKHYSVSDAENWWLRKRYGTTSVWGVDDALSKKYTRLDRIVFKILDLYQDFLNLTINKINARRSQKIKVKVDPWDTWSADYTLAHIILPVLRELKVKQQGIPMVDFADVPYELVPSEEEMERCKQEFDTDNLAVARWEYVMDQMIFAFESIVDDSWEGQFCGGEMDIIWTPVDVNGDEIVDKEQYTGKVYYRMDRGENDTYHFDREGYDKYQERITHGLFLFGKYYRALWT